MSDEPDPLPPLGGLALRALSAERARSEVDAGMQERVLTRVVASVAIGAAVTGVAATAHAAGATGAATGAATGTATGVAATATGLTLKTLPWIVAAFVVGGGVGAAVHAAVAPSSSASAMTPSLAGSATVTWPAPAVVPSTASTAPSAEAPSSLTAVPVTALPSAPAATATTGAAINATASAAHGAASATPPAASTGNDVDLAAERSLVDRARTALGRGQSSDALAALDAHAARYPRGRLSEEREALAVDALARSGRMDLALARAARFRAAYPNSVFGAAVDAALAPR